MVNVNNSYKHCVTAVTTRYGSGILQAMYNDVTNSFHNKQRISRWTVTSHWSHMTSQWQAILVRKCYFSFTSDLNKLPMFRFKFWINENSTSLFLNITRWCQIVERKGDLQRNPPAQCFIAQATLSQISFQFFHKVLLNSKKK